MNSPAEALRESKAVHHAKFAAAWPPPSGCLRQAMSLRSVAKVAMGGALKADGVLGEAVAYSFDAVFEMGFAEVDEEA
ncbi:hypothetical protein BH09VER1_BH09VER1_48900 [soil metagenome]